MAAWPGLTRMNSSFDALAKGESVGPAATVATVGVVSCKEGACPGYTLLSAAKTTYLIDNEGRVCHTWASKRNLFIAYLRPNGNLVRDGGDLELAPQFQAGGASGYLEEVNWNNELLWSWSALPRFAYLSHHDVQLLPNGNVLVLVWERKLKDEALAAGRHPELLPDGEVWNNIVIELQPDLATRSAAEVARWSQWDHLVQDYDPKRDNYVPDVAAHPSKYDINYCPPGGKAVCRNSGLEPSDHPSGFAVFKGHGKTGERDWLHPNGISHTTAADGQGYVLISYNVPSEVVMIAWPVGEAARTLYTRFPQGPDTADAHAPVCSQPAGGGGGGGGGGGKAVSKKRKADEVEDVVEGESGGGILCRFGNPLVARSADRFQRMLYNQHSAKFVPGGAEGKLRCIVFNNGQAPQRMWSTVDEFELDPKTGKSKAVWSFGPPCGHFASFYSHHSGGVRRCPDGTNTLVTMGFQGIAFEVTAKGEEVWRFISPVDCRKGGPPAVVRNGAQRSAGRFGLFFVERYAPEYCVEFASLTAGPRIEDFTPE